MAPQLRLARIADIPVRISPLLQQKRSPVTPSSSRCGTLNSLAGVISTIVNVYTQQEGQWSITAKVTIIVSGACALVSGLLYVLYNCWVLGGVRKSHKMEFERIETAPEGKTPMENVERV